MAKKPTIGDLLDKYEPALRDAFLASIQEITSKVQIGQVIKALERGDVQGAIDALYLDRAAYSAFERAIDQAFNDGGAATIDALGTLRDPSGAAFVVRFDARNPRAEQWLKSHSSELVTRIVDDQREAVRSVLVDGMAKGDNPRTTALDIVGRINRATGKREGGILGLSQPQEVAVRNARQELQEGRFKDFLQRARRDKRFDRTLLKALETGKPLTPAQIEKMINRYSVSLLKLRGDTIGRTEALASLNAAQHESLKQLVETGKVQANQIRRIWSSARDLRVRNAHRFAEGQSVGLNENFNVGGRFMAYPGDPAGGPENVINCRCIVNVRIDYFANLR